MDTSTTQGDEDGLQLPYALSLSKGWVQSVQLRSELNSYLNVTLVMMRTNTHPDDSGPLPAVE